MHYFKKIETEKAIIAMIIFILCLPVFALCDHSYPTSSSSNAVAVTGTWAYVADGSEGIKIIDLIQESSQTYNSTDFGYVYDVAVDGNFLYAAASNGLFILDISTHDSPFLDGRYITDGIAKSVAVSGNYACVADYAYGFQVIDISDPSSPTQEWTNWQSADLGDIWNLTIGDDGYLYIAEVGNGFSVWDISDPSAPFETGAGYDTDGYALDIAIKNGKAYVADGWNGILTFDVTATAPVLEYELTTGYGYGLYIEGIYLCFSEGEAGITLFDISSQLYPDASNEILNYDSGGKAINSALYNAGNSVILADGERGVYTFDHGYTPSQPGIPEIISHPADRTVAEGEDAIFSISATGTDLSFQWQRNGSDISGATGTGYTLSPAGLSDNGDTFRCIVSNPQGAVTSSEAVLTVTSAPPVITVHPTGITVLDGETATFNITASGTDIEYQWQRNGADISGANGISYTIPSAGLEYDGDSFRCVVSNSGGSVISNNAVLTVNMIPPAIINNPSNLTVTEGDSAAFTVSASGTDLTYQWQRNGSDIPGADMSTYTIAAADIGDDGAAFRCVVTNAGGSVTSNAAILTVIMNPPVIVTDPSNQTAEEGESATFYVTAAGTDLTYQWQRNGTDINGAAESSYTIGSIPVEYNGDEFRCVVTNGGGTVISNTAILTVTIALPVIVSHPADNTVVDGGTAVFLVTTTGTDLTYQWQRNGTDISGATGTGYTLSGVTLADDGDTFRCIVTNIAGSVTSNAASLTVQSVVEPVNIVSHPSDLTVTEGETAVFTITATGTSLTYQWQRNGTDISGAIGTGYTIPSAGLEYDGDTFRCVVANSISSVNSNSATLTVSTNPPIITGNPVDITVLEGEDAVFTVAASGTDMNFQWQQNGTDISGADSATYTLISAAYTNNGDTFRCIVTNNGGTVASRSALLTVNMIPPVIIQHPFDVTTMPGHTATFTVSASGSQLTYQWQRNGEDIDGGTESTCFIHPVLAEYDGDFICCIVSNQGGSVQSNVAVLTVTLDPIPPNIIEHPKSHSVKIGEDVTFSLIAEGTELNYQWRKDGINISGANQPDFQIINVSKDHIGNYSCYVSNVIGNDTSAPAALNVVEESDKDNSLIDKSDESPIGCFINSLF